jgi:hypothetical protein
LRALKALVCHKPQAMFCSPLAPVCAVLRGSFGRWILK